MILYLDSVVRITAHFRPCFDPLWRLVLEITSDPHLFLFIVHWRVTKFELVKKGRPTSCAISFISDCLCSLSLITVFRAVTFGGRCFLVRKIWMSDKICCHFCVIYSWQLNYWTNICEAKSFFRKSVFIQLNFRRFYQINFCSILLKSQPG